MIRDTQTVPDKQSSEWKTEETSVGTIQRGPRGEVLLPPGVFEDMVKLTESKCKYCR